MSVCSASEGSSGLSAWPPVAVDDDLLAQVRVPRMAQGEGPGLEGAVVEYGVAGRCVVHMPRQRGVAADAPAAGCGAVVHEHGLGRVWLAVEVVVQEDDPPGFPGGVGLTGQPTGRRAHDGPPVAVHGGIAGEGDGVGQLLRECPPGDAGAHAVP